ncbi:hypothetical protein TRFO_30526 [Tritrichomonas foetus]|uniref:VASt domain-containing protein n=1 Tax=Tritrichomonas foetus TaxID=1144522 RepID=A0A1J4JYQ0_9EUKA|nr:hypothetical protein TRFO_30526 [Tritrichomonas foetus]|eukprot:OHT02397.1 hypothetical protein TRFO_30526 [Tritrichomonas foetus]
MVQGSIKEFSCFFVQNFSHSGTLVLFPDHLVFLYANGSEDKDTLTYYAAITDVEVETRLARTVNNLSIITSSDKLIFSGLHDAESLKEYILLLKRRTNSKDLTTGFTSPEVSDDYTYSELANPTLLCSFTIPAQFENIVDYIESKESQKKLIEDLGNEDVEVGEWVQRLKYKERVMNYTKIVVLPVLGRNMVKVIENHHLFISEGKAVICVSTDLGTTPYSDCFDPLIQIFFIDNGESVEYSVKFEIMWSSTPFVKSIIENKTIEEFRNVYSNVFYRQLLKDIAGQDVSNQAKEEEEAPKVERKSDSKFKKIKMMYKLIIIILFLLLFVSIVRYNWPEDGFTWGAKQWYTFVVGLFFVFVMAYY